MDPSEKQQKRTGTTMLVHAAGHRRSPATTLGITSIYLQGIDSTEIIDTIHSRPALLISAPAGLTGK